MKPLYTLSMLVILGLLAAYVFFFERSPVVPENTSPKTRILNLEPAKVKRLSLQKAKQQLILEKSGANQWQIKSPQPGGAADASRINTLLDHLKDWPAAQVLESNFQGAKQEFGLEPPQLKLHLETATGPVNILIGNKTPINSGYYVLSPAQNQLLVSYVNIPEELEQMLKSPPRPSSSPGQQTKKQD